jgi:hypothetical protein
VGTLRGISRIIIHHRPSSLTVNRFRHSSFFHRWLGKASTTLFCRPPLSVTRFAVSSLHCQIDEKQLTQAWNNCPDIETELTESSPASRHSGDKDSTVLWSRDKRPVGTLSLLYLADETYSIERIVHRKFHLVSTTTPSSHRTYRFTLSVRQQ